MSDSQNHHLAPITYTFFVQSQTRHEVYRKVRACCVQVLLPPCPQGPATDRR